VRLKKSLPNVITVFRLLDVVLLLILWSLSLKRRLIFLLFLCLGILSDSLDGFLARRLKATSRLGAILDPIADKVFVDTLFFLLYLEKVIPFYFLFVVVLRDILIVLGVLFLFKRKKEFTPAPLFVGKLCTFFLMLFLFAGWTNYYLNVFPDVVLKILMNLGLISV